MPAKMHSFASVLPSDQAPWLEKILLNPVRRLIRENCGVSAFGVNRRPTCAKEKRTPMPVHTRTIGSAARAAVSRPPASTDIAAEVVGGATESMTLRKNESTRLAARPANLGNSTATARRLAHAPSSDD